MEQWRLTEPTICVLLREKIGVENYRCHCHGGLLWLLHGVVHDVKVLHVMKLMARF